jgi:hypothetical protein
MLLVGCLVAVHRKFSAVGWLTLLCIQSCVRLDDFMGTGYRKSLAVR